MQSEVPEGAMGYTEGAIAPSAPVWLQAWSPVILKRVSMFIKGAPVIQNGATHGSSEGHEMLQRNDKYHSIADDVPIPKM